MRQEQVEITTPQTQTKVVLKGYTTGRVDQAIKAIVQGHIHVEYDPNTSQASAIKVPAIIQQEASNKAVELLVISVNGQTENVLDRVLDLPAGDSDFIAAQVDKIVQGAGLDEKKSPISPANGSSPDVTVTGQ